MREEEEAREHLKINPQKAARPRTKASSARDRYPQRRQDASSVHNTPSPATPRPEQPRSTQQKPRPAPFVLRMGLFLLCHKSLRCRMLLPPIP